VTDFLYLTLEHVHLYHEVALEEDGGFVGMRDQRALEDVVSSAQKLIDTEPAADVFDVAAAYCQGVVQNQPFLDGNERAGLATALGFLEVNGYIDDRYAESHLQDAMIYLAEKSLDRQRFADYLRVGYTGITGNWEFQP
jgi:death on curing protein